MSNLITTPEHKKIVIEKPSQSVTEQVGTFFVVTIKAQGKKLVNLLCHGFFTIFWGVVFMLRSTTVKYEGGS